MTRDRQETQEKSERRGPPEALFKVVNPMMKWLLRSPLHGFVSGRILLLGFTGRKSGRSFVTPVGYHEDEGRLVSFTRRPWAENFSGGAPVTIWLRGRKQSAHAETTRDVDEILRVLDRFTAVNGAEAIAMRIGGAQFAGEAPTPQELRQAASELALIRIRPEAAP